MISVGEQLAAAITGGSFRSYYVADVIVDGQVVLSNQPLAQCQLDADTSRQIVTQGTATFVWADDQGGSILPETVTSWFTPFATYLDVSYVVEVGGFRAQVLRGRFKLVGVSDPQSRVVKFQDRLLTVGSSLTLKLADLFYVTSRERFAAPSTPSDLSSVYAEIGRLTGLPVIVSVPDAAITRSVTYDENRLDAVLELAKILDGHAYVTPDGGVSIAPNQWGPPVTGLSMGAQGTIHRADPDDMTDSRVYNQVVVRSWDDQQATILATAEVEAGPLRYGGPMGRVPYFAASQYVVTKEQAQEYADALLPQVSVMPAVTYTIQCAPDPRLEVWDVVTVTTQDDTFEARISKIILPGTGAMTLTVEVDRGSA